MHSSHFFLFMFLLKVEFLSPVWYSGRIFCESWLKVTLVLIIYDTDAHSTWS